MSTYCWWWKQIQAAGGLPKEGCFTKYLPVNIYTTEEKMARQKSISSAWYPLERAAVPCENRVSHKHKHSEE